MMVCYNTGRKYLLYGLISWGELMFFHFVQAPRENRMKQKVTRNGEFLATSIGGFDS